MIHFGTMSACDGRTDEFTIASTVLCIATYVDAL